MNEPKLSKKQQVQQWLQTRSIDEWAQCIHCQEPLQLDEYALCCKNNHRFDSAKQGYYYLTTKRSMDTKYDKQLFEARRLIIMESPFYDALHDFFAQNIKLTNGQLIVDAGSGEGSHLARITQSLSTAITAVAFDLSKAGIQLSSDYNFQQLSAVSDLAHMPLQNHSVDVILSILSPSNYLEFKRVLKPSGRLVKVIPNANYLKEIREALAVFGLRDQEEAYDNEQVVKVFIKHFPIYQMHRIQNEVSLTLLQKENLLKMTPLAWNLSAVQREKVLQYLPQTLSLDVTVLSSK